MTIFKNIISIIITSFCFNVFSMEYQQNDGSDQTFQKSDFHLSAVFCFRKNIDEQIPDYVNTIISQNAINFSQHNHDTGSPHMTIARAIIDNARVINILYIFLSASDKKKFVYKFYNQWVSKKEFEEFREKYCITLAETDYHTTSQGAQSYAHSEKAFFSWLLSEGGSATSTQMFTTYTQQNTAQKSIKIELRNLLAPCQYCILYLTGTAVWNNNNLFVAKYSQRALQFTQNNIRVTIEKYYRQFVKKPHPVSIPTWLIPLKC